MDVDELSDGLARLLLKGERAVLRQEGRQEGLTRIQIDSHWGWAKRADEINNVRSAVCLAMLPLEPKGFPLAVPRCEFRCDVLLFFARYLDVTCLVFGADHTYLEPIDYDHRISTEAVGKQGAVQHSGEPACLHMGTTAVLHAKHMCFILALYGTAYTDERALAGDILSGHHSRGRQSIAINLALLSPYVSELYVLSLAFGQYLGLAPNGRRVLLHISLMGICWTCAGISSCLYGWGPSCR